MLRALSMLPNGTQQTDQPVDSPKAVIILAIQGGPEDEPFFDPPFPRPEKMREMNSQVVADQRNQNLARHKLPFGAHHRAHPPPHQHPDSNRDHIACGVDPSTKSVGTLAPRFLGAERLELGGRYAKIECSHFVLYTLSVIRTMSTTVLIGTWQICHCWSVSSEPSTAACVSLAWMYRLSRRSVSQACRNWTWKSRSMSCVNK